MSLRVHALRQIVIAISSIGLAATAPGSVNRVVPYAHFFTIRLETNKQTYRAGELINVRIFITNVTDRAYNIVAWQPVALLPLTVRNNQGVQITPTVPGQIERIDSQTGFTPTYHLAPKATVAIGWIGIDKFGYALKQPGMYTITTSLHGVGGSATGSVESFGMSGEEKSNTATIQILP